MAAEVSVKESVIKFDPTSQEMWEVLVGYLSILVAKDVLDEEDDLFAGIGELVLSLEFEENCSQATNNKSIFRERFDLNFFTSLRDWIIKEGLSEFFDETPASGSEGLTAVSLINLANSQFYGGTGNFLCVR